MPESNRDDLERKIRLEIEKRLPSLVDKIAEFSDRPGAKTLYDSEKGINKILDEIGDGIMGEAFKDAAESREFVEAAMEAFKKTSQTR